MTFASMLYELPRLATRRVVALPKSVTPERIITNLRGAHQRHALADGCCTDAQLTRGDDEDGPFSPTPALNEQGDGDGDVAKASDSLHMLLQNARKSRL